MARSFCAHDIMMTSGKDNPVDQANATASQARVEPPADHSSQGFPPSPRVVVVCPSCKATLSVKRVYIGSAVRCKQCDHAFSVPIASDRPAQHAEGDTTSGSVSHSQPVNAEAESRQTGGSDKVLLSQLGKVLARNKELRSAYDQLQAQRDDLIANQDELAAQHKSELAAARAELAPLSEQVEQLKTELQAACHERDQHHAEQNDSTAKQDELRANHKSELAAARAELAPLNAQIEQLKSDRKSVV